MANDFLPFATDPAANVISQGAWAALAARNNGFVAGVAQSPQLNKAWRQASVMAAALGQLIDTYSDRDALDDGDIVGLTTKIAQTFQAGMFSYVVATGTANAWVLSPTPAVPSYSAGRVLWVKAPATNTSTTVNANVSGLTSRRLKKADGTDPAIGDLVSGCWYPTIDDGTNICIVAALPSDILNASSRVGRMQVFTASGTFVVPAAVKAVWVRVIAGGGAGGGAPASTGQTGAGGGAAGGYAEKWCAVTPGQSVPVTVGSGGNSNGAGFNGLAGGSSSFGAFCSASGGLGGAVNGNTNAIGGVGSGGDLNLYGSGGQQGTMQGTSPVGGPGGGPPFGGGSTSNSFAQGYDAQGYGAGGGGAGGTTQRGGLGAPGLVIVQW